MPYSTKKEDLHVSMYLPPFVYKKDQDPWILRYLTYFKTITSSKSSNFKSSNSLFLNYEHRLWVLTCLACSEMKRQIKSNSELCLLWKMEENSEGIFILFKDNLSQLAFSFQPFEDAFTYVQELWEDLTPEIKMIFQQRWHIHPKLANLNPWKFDLKGNRNRWNPRRAGAEGD